MDTMNTNSFIFSSAIIKAAQLEVTAVIGRDMSAILSGHCGLLTPRLEGNFLKMLLSY